MKRILSFACFTFLLASSGFAKDAPKPAAAPKTETATFAGGCFWCMQPAFDLTQGVKSTVVGYTGGTMKNPSYGDVSSGGTGHAESIQIVFDPAVVKYEALLDTYWKNINPTTKNRQFADSGTQYRTAIFYNSEAQKKAALASKERYGKMAVYGGQPIVTEILPAGPFYPAEEYHQGYYRKNPDAYEAYKVGSGRAGYLKKLWGTSAH